MGWSWAGRGAGQAEGKAPGKGRASSERSGNLGPESLEQGRVGVGGRLEEGDNRVGDEDMGREWSALPNAAIRSWHTRPGRWLRNLVM